MKLKHSFKVGFSFGTTSGIITSLGTIVGLYASTHSKLVVVGAILTIAISDSFSDALGIHISEESEGIHTKKEIWESTISTFISKFIFALTFVVPFIFLNLKTAVITCIIMGLVMLSIISFYLNDEKELGKWNIIAEHLFIAIIVIVINNFVGNWISFIFV